MTPTIEPLGDCALLVGFGECIDSELNARALALANALRTAGIPGVCDVAAAYASVCVRYDPRAWVDATGSRTPFDCIAACVTDIAAQPAASMASANASLIEIPVCYGGDFGSDLAEVAAHAGIGEDEVIARHTAAEYRVAMLGFAPGFPYLFGLDALLQTPRCANPRTRVAAGSVAIGGAQTGIYPRELPGGWRIIGRTPLTLFDPARDPPALLAPGQRVRFSAVDAQAFAALSP